MALILIGFLMGLNEISVVFFIGALAFVNVAQLIKTKRISGIALTWLSVSVLCGLLSFLSPGNTVRAGQTTGDADMVETLGRALGFTLYIFVELMSRPPLLLASGLYLVFLEVNRDRIGQLCSSLSAVRWYWILGFLVSATFVSVALIAGVGIHSLTERVRNVYTYSLTLGWFLLLTVLFVNLTAQNVHFVIPKWVIGLCVAFMLVFLATGFSVEITPDTAIPSASRTQRVFAAIRTKSIFANAYLDILSGRAAGYAQQNEETTRRFRAAQGGCVELARPSHAPQTIFLDWVKYPSTWCPLESGHWRGQRSP
jgi:hypothetical protein